MISSDTRFIRCFGVVCGPAIEGGYTNDPKDPGGPTNHGITQATLSHWRGAPASIQDVMDLTLDDARAIYRANYWGVVAGDSLPAGVDLITFDAAVNQGPGYAVAFLQRAAGATVDMHIGPRTIAAVVAQDSATLIARIAEERMERYRSLPGWAHDGHGWTNRVDAVEKQALAWADGN